MAVGDYDARYLHSTEDTFQVSTQPQAPKSILGTQVGGHHYTDLTIQPIEYIWANNIGFSEGNIIKYVSRWKAKGGVKDLKKAHHHLALLIEREEAKLVQATVATSGL